MQLLQDQFKAFSSWMEREQIIRYNDSKERKSSPWNWVYVLLIKIPIVQNINTLVFRGFFEFFCLADIIACLAGIIGF